MKLYKTLYPIKELGIVIPPNTIVSLAFLSKVDAEFGYFEFLGGYVGLAKLISMSDVVPCELDEEKFIIGDEHLDYTYLSTLTIEAKISY